MIRKALYHDLAAINEIYNLAVKSGGKTADLQTVSLEERQDWFNQHRKNPYQVFVMEKEERVLAWLSFSAYRKGREALEKVAEISYYIHPEFQSQGYGSSLMSFAIQQAPLLGISHLIAILLSVNNASIALLIKFGFEEWGRMPNIANIPSHPCDHLYFGLKL